MAISKEYNFHTIFAIFHSFLVPQLLLLLWSISSYKLVPFFPYDVLILLHLLSLLIFRINLQDIDILS